MSDTSNHGSEVSDLANAVRKLAEIVGRLAKGEATINDVREAAYVADAAKQVAIKT
jgi:hypothetical protein